jgi:opacity protein-like surface antigen
MKRAPAITALLICTAGAPLKAQALYLGVRGGVGIPSGKFAEKATGTGNDALLRGASAGLGYGLDAGIGSPLVGLYAGYDRIRFGCQSGECSTSGKYELTGYSAGIRVSVPLLPLLRPWAKAGVTYNEMKGSVNGVSVTTGKSPGYELGAGVDIPILMGFFSLSPQVRRIRQRLEPNDSGKRDADYYTFDLGLRVRTPL